MSRSAFAARFNALVGEAPMHYVARWRMHVALMWLRDDCPGLGELANRLGYQSEAAFSRAFKRFNGVSPGAARRSGDSENNPHAAWQAVGSDARRECGSHSFAHTRVAGVIKGGMATN
jgi:AraC-like DNA-binding protein